jgi:two-component sensor histidine kinase
VPDDVLDAFESRLGALGRAHEQLLRERWESADLDLIARQILAPFRTPSTTVHIEGSPLKLRPQPAVTIGFVLHELAINATRHGALSVAGGAVDLRWGLTDQRALRIEWRESCGPQVRPPERRGFGSRLLEWGIVQELKGGVNARYEPSGFSCRIEIPLATIAA